MVEAEKSDRLSNIKYVVDEVNSVNKDIYTTLSTSNQTINTSLSSLSTQHNTLKSDLNTYKADFNTYKADLNTGFGKWINLSSNTATIKLTELPGAQPGGVDIKLLGNVIATMGMTAVNLTPAKPFKLCNGEGNTTGNCMKFPDADGNTYLTSLTNGGKIVLDAPTKVNNSLDVSGMVRTSNMISLCENAGQNCVNISAVKPSGAATQLNFGNDVELMYKGKAIIVDAETQNLKLAA
jgi:hypothetical protein